MFDKKLLDILACPVCKNDFEYVNDELICCRCQKAFPVECGIPILLIEKSRDLKEEKNNF
jgi:uncharacterized protein YbaR (Trm112 family)